MREGRWVTVTESEFDHERRGLEAIREKLPDSDPWRAWSNFTFTANTGHVREVDLLVVAPGGVCMIELKDWHGSVTSENGTWVQTTPGGRRRTHGNPLHLVNRKAKELAGLLALPGNKRVWVAEAVCFTDNSLRVRLPAHDQNGVYTVDELVEMLKQPPRDERRRITAISSREIAGALKNIGIRKSDAQYKVGPYELERKSFESGPTWADYLARHSDLPEAARVRIYLSDRGSDASLRQSVENAARREAAVLGRFKHPGVVELKQYFPSGHAAGPALIFDYHPDTLKLDEYLVQYGEKLDILGRMALVRQLAETMRSAHSSRIHHRALAARSVLVVPRPRGRKGRAVGEDGQGTEGGGRPRRREETVARQLRENGRLQVDQLEAYGDYLFGAVDFLEGEGVWHRDIKPDNIAIRIRPNRTRELVLIDFSLAGYPAKSTNAGTDGYLDPFVDVITRGSYDSHAERYAVAVTLHQMASGELPKWGDGSVPPRMTDAKEWPYPTIAAEAFDPAVRDGLVAFFQKALHRDAGKRFPELKPMRDAWRKVFLDASQTVPSSHRSRHPAPATTGGDTRRGRRRGGDRGRRAGDRRTAARPACRRGHAAYSADGLRTYARCPVPTKPGTPTGPLPAGSAGLRAKWSSTPGQDRELRRRGERRGEPG